MSASLGYRHVAHGLATAAQVLQAANETATPKARRLVAAIVAMVVAIAPMVAAIAAAMLSLLEVEATATVEEARVATAREVVGVGVGWERR